MKKLLLLTFVALSFSAATIGLPPLPQTIERLYGVITVNQQPVIYLENVNGPEGFIAKIGAGVYSGTCYHDGIRYADIKGSASCPGYFSVFPSIPVTGNTVTLKETNVFNVIHSIYGGSPACEESQYSYDPFR